MKTSHAVLTVLLSAVVGTGCGGSKVTTLYVAADGDDGWSGSPEKPFATIARARDTIRELKRSKGVLARPVMVYIRGGVYELADPLVFTPEDSGTEQCTVIYTAAPGESPVFSGGRKITGWTVFGAPRFPASKTVHGISASSSSTACGAPGLVSPTAVSLQ